MEDCIELGHYVHANDCANRTLSGVLQQAQGDLSGPAMRLSNDFVEATRTQQQIMFRTHLPPMEMGGPDHVRQHISYTFYRHIQRHK